MEIASIEPKQSISLSWKELKGTLATIVQDRWREEWAVAQICQTSSALADVQVSDSSAILRPVSQQFAHFALPITLFFFLYYFLRLFLLSVSLFLVLTPSGLPFCSILLSHTSLSSKIWVLLTHPLIPFFSPLNWHLFHSCSFMNKILMEKGIQERKPKMKSCSRLL